MNTYAILRERCESERDSINSNKNQREKGDFDEVHLKHDNAVSFKSWDSELDRPSLASSCKQTNTSISKPDFVAVFLCACTSPCITKTLTV